jgi:hypothetical protein
MIDWLQCFGLVAKSHIMVLSFNRKKIACFIFRKQREGRGRISTEGKAAMT